ncbi:lipid II-degrading bacteriocin [Enterobacter hormaechei]|uniref:lipid II-degrading bacteriocin n=1 Tax=Enterobacter hormaechei TaxID=158836 RepID=UPI0013620C1F|nr:lipid II-degrading bacteriocin [Enterobacter hormaechei]QHI57278.1 lipid II-degrading bacteriocin [Enterobacter hormaechei]
MDTLVVTAPTPSGASFTFDFGDMGNYNSVGSSWADLGSMPSMIEALAVEAMENGEFTKGVLAGWLKLNKNNRSNLLPVLKRMAQIESLKAANPKFTYYTISNTGGVYSKEPGNKVTANAFAPFLGMYHYISGKQTPLTMDLNSIGLTFTPKILTPLSSTLANNPPGIYNISGNFGKSVFDDNLSVGALIGRISMKTEGVLTIYTSGAWKYEGQIKAFNDTFDANFDPSRGVVAQAATTVLSWFPGKTYEIQLPGSIPVKMEGKK